jgi:hypothetical protein
MGVSLDAHLSPQRLIERVPFVRGGDTLLQPRDQTFRRRLAVSPKPQYPAACSP